MRFDGISSIPKMEYVCTNYNEDSNMSVILSSAHVWSGDETKQCDPVGPCLYVPPRLVFTICVSIVQT